jgi:hypothetical protein
MGDRFKRQQAKNFEKGRDRALEEAGRPKLFQRSEVVRTIYTLLPIDGNTGLKEGDHLLALTEESGGPVFAVRGHEKVGVVEGDGAEALRQAVTASNGPRIAELLVTSVSELSGAASAEVVERAAQQ